MESSAAVIEAGEFDRGATRRERRTAVYNLGNLAVSQSARDCARFTFCAARQNVGEWLSLVEHLVRDQGVGGSNPLSPTNTSMNPANVVFEGCLSAQQAGTENCDITA